MLVYIDFSSILGSKRFSSIYYTTSRVIFYIEIQIGDSFQAFGKNIKIKV